MAEEVKEEIKEEEVAEEKGALGKLKDAILPDAEEQAAIVSTFVRLGVLVWSGGILTLNYVAIPGCLLYTSPSPRDRQKSRMPSSA